MTDEIVNKPLEEQDRDVMFRKMADSFIDVANRHCESREPSHISSSFLFGASRFCSFVVASKAGSAEGYDKQKNEALDYYTAEFRTMLEQNLEDYKRIFDEADEADEHSPH